MQTVYGVCCRHMCICPSVCHKSELPKIAKCQIMHTTLYISADTVIVLMPKISAKFQWGHPQWGCQIHIRLKLAVFGQYLDISRKLCKIEKANIGTWIMLFPVTLI